MAGITIQDSESLDLYLRDISSSKPLSGAEEIELARLIKKGNQRARDQLVSANLRFVVSVAREYQNHGVPLSDLISAGNVGLMTAAERFDGTRGFKFISYAVWWIRQAIHQSLAQDSRVVRLPINRIDLLHNISKVSRELRQNTEKEPEPEVIAKELGVSEEMVKDTLLRARDVWSLDASFKEDDEHSLINILPDTSQQAPDTEVVEDSVKIQVEEVLESLDDREQEVLRLYFGLGDDEPMTLEEIGVRFNLTRERVRQIKEKALRRLRHPRRCALLEPLMEPA
ncbi:RNA polymerase sigma factor RpoD/SigA [bacterium]|nr:RNA polymerase subunit sigma [Gemmatimonadota bacterium]MCH2665466.1 RNA polymerase sigma factor RpoD/SigA [bacterium]HCK11971.1 RNA polymerase subunit sigma [Candidatus Latescibacterota bacterium]